MQRSSQNQASLRLGDTTLTVKDLPAAMQVVPGSRCTLGVRPRAFEFAPESAEDTFPVLLDLIEPMGAETLLHVLFGSQDLRVVVPRDTPARVGERLHIRCRPGQAHLFNDVGNLVVP